MNSLVYGGLDVHKDSISVCLLNRETGTMVQEQVANDEDKLLRAARRWQKLGPLRLCYEASGAGFVIKRWFDAAGVACEVIAPSHVPKAPGDRVKTDRRDAKKLAQLYAADLLTSVRTPSEEEEHIRATVRFRDQITRDTTRTKNRILKQLGRLGIRYRGGDNWTVKHRYWLQQLSLQEDEAYILNGHLSTLSHLESQRQALDEKIAKIAEQPQYREGVRRLLCLRGIQLYSAMVLLTEIGDIRRFATAPELMSYLGLVPSEHSSGNDRNQGKITKTGNSRGRWILGQAAWNQARRPGGGRVAMHWRTQAPELVAIGRKAQQRLHQTFWRIACRKDRRIAVTAVAREMAGFVWALLTAPCTAQ
jgi:transposase